MRRWGNFAITQRVAGCCDKDDASVAPAAVIALLGALWLERVTRTYPACVWLNPVPEEEWDCTHSIKMVQQLMSGRMYPLTLAGLDRAMRELVR